MKTKLGPPLRNNRWVKILMMVLLPLWLAACASTPNKEGGQKFKAQQKYDEALQARSLNQVDEEIVKLKEATVIDPREPFYHMELGDAYFSNNELKEAEQGKKSWDLLQAKGKRAVGSSFLHSQARPG